MTARTLLRPRLFTLAALGLSAGPAAYPTHAYVISAEAGPLDTLRVRLVERASRARPAGRAAGVTVSGYLSSRGLPPVQGEFTLSDTGLIFRSIHGLAKTFPLVGPQREVRGRQRRPSTVSLAYVDEENGRPAYVFRIDAGVFETEAPGPLLELAAHPGWLDSLGPTAWTSDVRLVDGSDSSALRAAARRITTSAYADSLYALFGRPRAAVGLIGRRGRSAGRLGEYIGARDSLALDPGRMTGEPQLRHTLAHELGHRWQSRAPNQLATLWWRVPAIRDPKRYGYEDEAEHQAEAIAFAVHFLQATTTRSEPAAGALQLLDHYELLVPGTRTMVRYLALQPLYRDHPLRTLLITGVE